MGRWIYRKRILYFFFSFCHWRCLIKKDKKVFCIYLEKEKRKQKWNDWSRFCVSVLYYKLIRWEIPILVCLGYCSKKSPKRLGPIHDTQRILRPLESNPISEIGPNILGSDEKPARLFLTSLNSLLVLRIDRWCQRGSKNFKNF